MDWQNPRTTLAGYVVCLGAIAYIIVHAIQGNLSMNDLIALGGIVAGAGLISAHDGGH